MARGELGPGEAERVPWEGPEGLRAGFFGKFEQGEHVAIIGPTGSGKTTLSVDLLNGFYEHGGSVLVLANKPRDPLLSKLQREGWPRIRQWPPDYAHRQKRRIILWPSYGRASRASKNKATFEYALDMAINEGGWFVYVDELRYVCEQLGMRKQLDEVWNGARSSKITLVAGAQGTSWTPRGHRDQQTWLFLFKPRNLEQRKEYADAAGEKEIAAELAQLQPHEFMLVHMADGRRYISKVGT